MVVGFLFIVRRSAVWFETAQRGDTDMATNPDDGNVYEGTLNDDGSFEVPIDEVGNTACVFDAETGTVFDYVVVEDGGHLEVDSNHGGQSVNVVIPNETG